MKNKRTHWKRVGAVLMIGMLCFSGCGEKQKITETTPAPTASEPTEAQPTQAETPDPIQLNMEKDVLFFGRTYKKGNVHWLNWSGSGFSMCFQGSEVQAEFYSNAPDVKNWAYLKVYVDGVEQKDIALSKSTQIVTLAKGLDATKTHTLEVRKRTNARSSSAGLGRLFLMDGEVLTPPEPKERLIEFIGDSLTVGYVASKEGKTAKAWSTATEDVTKTYCPQIAEAFDAQYQVVAISGRGVVRNNGGDQNVLFPDIYREQDYFNNPGVACDFQQHPDVIVVNLGTNDESAANENLPAEEFKAGLYDYLTELRQYHPDAQILYTYGLVRVKLSSAIQEVVQQLRDEGDEKIHYLQLQQCESWELNLNHTVSTAYPSRGDAIIEKIREITGW